MTLPEGGHFKPPKILNRDTCNFQKFEVVRRTPMENMTKKYLVEWYD